MPPVEMEVFRRAPAAAAAEAAEASVKPCCLEERAGRLRELRPAEAVGAQVTILLDPMRTSIPAGTEGHITEVMVLTEGPRKETVRPEASMAVEVLERGGHRMGTD